jgi:hypothetical protein
LSLNADIGTRWCVVVYGNQKVQKAPKHDFWAYWSVLGAFVVKTHFATRAASFCPTRAVNLFHLMAILPHVGAMLYTVIKKFKKHQNMIF